MSKKDKRPKTRGEIPLDWTRLNQYLELGARLIDCSEFLSVSEDKIQDQIKRHHAMTFMEYRDKKMAKMRLRVLQKQFDVAMQGNVAMLIWLGKQILGQTEKIEQQNTETTPQRLIIKIDGGNE